jgi:hypothetical protein
MVLQGLPRGFGMLDKVHKPGPMPTHQAPNQAPDEQTQQKKPTSAMPNHEVITGQHRDQ